MPVIPYSIKTNTKKAVRPKQEINNAVVQRVQLDEGLVVFFLLMFLCKLCSAAVLRCTNRFS